MMPGVVDGYDYVGYGSCRDESEEPYPTVSQLYTSSAESCGDFCDKMWDFCDKFHMCDKFHISIVNGTMDWTDANFLSQTCFCVFDKGTDVERIANELGGGREHWGHWVPADSSNEGVGIGPVTRVGESNHSYCYK